MFPSRAWDEQYTTRRVTPKKHLFLSTQVQTQRKAIATLWKKNATTSKLAPGLELLLVSATNAPPESARAMPGPRWPAPGTLLRPTGRTGRSAGLFKRDNSSEGRAVRSNKHCSVLDQLAGFSLTQENDASIPWRGKALSCMMVLRYPLEIESANSGLLRFTIELHASKENFGESRLPALLKTIGNNRSVHTSPGAGSGER